MDDCYYENTYYATVAGMNVVRLNFYEAKLADMLEFELFVDRECYEKYMDMVHEYERRVRHEGPENIVEPKAGMVFD